MKALRTTIDAPVDAAGLAAFRVLFGATMLLGLVRFLASGWIDKVFVAPRYFFTYPGFEWVTPWAAWGMHLHYAVLAVLALCICVGLFYRAAIVLFTLGFAYVQLI